MMEIHPKNKMSIVQNGEAKEPLVTSSFLGSAQARIMCNNIHNEKPIISFNKELRLLLACVIYKRY